MPTPSIPSAFKPVAQGYNVGSPDGVRMSEVGGGLPRIAMEWDRGQQRFQVGMVMSSTKFTVWSIFFHRVIRNGSLQFLMPLDSGQGLQDHTCIMVPGSYSAVPVSGSKLWSVGFSVTAQAQVYDMSDADVQAVLDLWEAAGEGSAALLERIAQFATVDTLVLAP
jgi:hypothetical protein